MLFIIIILINNILSHIDWFSECDDPAEYFYPPRFSRKAPQWVENQKIETEACFLYKEIYTAFYNSSHRLASMGIRTLFDIYIHKKVGDQGQFETALGELLKRGHITASQKVVIGIAVDAGNASVHRSFYPDIETLTTVLDIVENLYHLDVLEKEALKVKNITPQREKKRKPIHDHSH